jgi:hypothetical protein
VIDFSSIRVPSSNENRQAASSRDSNEVNCKSIKKLTLILARFQSNHFENEKARINDMRQMILSDPVQFEMIKQRFPELANAIQRNDVG